MGYTKDFIMWFMVPYIVTRIMFYNVHLNLLISSTASIVLIASSFLMMYGAKRMTNYMVTIYGPEVESNPNTRKMYETGDFTMMKVAYLLIACTFLALIILALLGITSETFPLSFAVASFTFTTQDFIHDYRIYRKYKVP